ncbi:MAG: repressor LexA [Kiritimatiellaeota bacterium]|nr:repressor LexA [Kiritimatiellota bacterium]
MKGLTARQKDFIHFIERFSVTEGMAPTVYEIADHFGIKTSTVFAHLKALQKKGFITRSSKARSIALSRKVAILERRKLPVVEIPLFKKLEAGKRSDSSQNREGTITFDSTFLGGDVNHLFALRVVGDAMSGLGIFDADVVIVRETHSIRRGDVVVALVGGETLLRSYYPAKDVKLELRPANTEFESLALPIEELEIMGKVIGLQRQY